MVRGGSFLANDNGIMAFTNIFLAHSDYSIVMALINVIFARYNIITTFNRIFFDHNNNHSRIKFDY
jgi:hypothetical protein